MSKGLNAQGFTIVEALIVLAVTGLLLASAMRLISGQQQKTEFSQAINDIQSQIKEVINNVATGYYSGTNNFNCVAGANAPRVSSIGPAKPRGTNSDCIYIGRAMQFGVDGSQNDFNTYDLVGLQFISPGVLATNLSTEVKPIALSYSTNLLPSLNGYIDNGVNTTDQRTLQYGLSVNKMTYTSSGVPTATGAVAFITSLGNYTGADLDSGTQAVSLYAVNNTAIGQDHNDVIGRHIDFPTDLNNPVKQVDICFASGGTDQFGIITIGSKNNGRQLTTTLKIADKTPTPTECT